MKKVFDFESILSILDQKGLNPRVCDTPVPYYDNRVRCGSPLELGDVVEETRLWPKALLTIAPEYVVTVSGNSMKDAGIDEGDEVRVRAVQTPRDGDIVLMLIDGECTIKTYCTDEDGCVWLVPQNDSYDAFPLSSVNASLMGVVCAVVKKSPRTSYRACMDKIARARAKQSTPVCPKRVKKAINAIGQEIKVARHWYAVYRTFVDMKIIPDGDFAPFCSLVSDILPSHTHLPRAEELQRLALQSFRRPVILWREDDAPVSGKRFRVYLTLAQRTRELMKER